MKLSILVPTIEGRSDDLYRLLWHESAEGTGLYWQIKGHDTEVELVIDHDNGQKTIGAKRQGLLERATGDYICFVDDDDMVSGDYVAKILEAIQTCPDCCSLIGEIHFNNGVTRQFRHSVQYDKWEKVDDVYLRYPNHLNAVKRELALQAGFKDMNKGEDRDYSDRLKPLLSIEVQIDGIIYHYNCRESG